MRLPLLIPLCAAIAWPVAAQEGNGTALDATDAAAEANRDYMNGLVLGYVLSVPGENKTRLQLELHQGNLLRWNNPVSGVRPGGVYLWTGDGRPAAVLKMFRHPKYGWFQQFQSLWSTPLSAQQADGKKIWIPQRPGIEFDELSSESHLSGGAGLVGRLAVRLPNDTG
jgi:hypothetical protein